MTDGSMLPCYNVESPYMSVPYYTKRYPKGPALALKPIQSLTEAERRCRQLYNNYRASCAYRHICEHYAFAQVAESICDTG